MSNNVEDKTLIFVIIKIIIVTLQPVNALLIAIQPAYDRDNKRYLIYDELSWFIYLFHRALKKWNFNASNVCYVIALLSMNYICYQNPTDLGLQMKVYTIAVDIFLNILASFFNHLLLCKLIFISSKASESRDGRYGFWLA